MTPDDIDTTFRVINLIIEAAATSGAAGVAWKWLQKQGIDTQALHNNKLVFAAKNLAPTLLKDVMLQGKSILDPTVIADVEASIKTSLLATHKESIAGAGATDADIATIAKNAVSGEVKASLDATTQVQSVQTANPIDKLVEAKQLLTQATSVIGTASLQPAKPPATPPYDPAIVAGPTV